MKYYTMKDIADTLKVSKTTVRKTIKAAAIDYDKVESNKYFYSIDKTKQIIKNINSDFDLRGLQSDLETENSKTKFANSQTKTTILTANSQTETENSKTKFANSQTETENSKTKFANSQTETENSKTIEVALNILEKQLNEKDNTIKDLQEKLAAAYTQIGEQSKTIADLAAKAQYITAADKTAQLLDKQENNQEEVKEKKKWFEFWKQK